MKKLSTLIVALFATVSIMAQAQGNLRFAGKANVSIPMFGFNSDIESDTVVVSDANSAITIPQLSGNGMVIPSIKIGGLAYKMSGSPMTGNMSFTWEKADTTFDVNGKTVRMTNMVASYIHAQNKFAFSATVKYGAMPATVNYAFEGYYLKSVGGETTVSIAGTYNYTASPTYIIRKYMDGEVEKVDVEIPTYQLPATLMGDLTIGTYTVKGLVFDMEKGGFYRDYSEDGLIMHFSAEQSGVKTLDKDYALDKGNSGKNQQNILVQYNGTSVSYICNNFQPGAMPMAISTTYGTLTGIHEVESTKNNAGNDAFYNIKGQRLNANSKGIIIRNGRKYFQK